ncbi:MAG: hypothetical protein COB85_09275 [Bacteroidetes bacterium]|nr:MAG: hypothetical protein COB85_09275 [Bacteroidota bacterium]
MKNTYYYIDEAGGIKSNSKFFILGCYKTDSPDQIKTKIESLKEEIINSPYFAFEREKFIEQGFHASENHFDIRARFFNLISTLNIRSYILLLSKNSSFFKKLIDQGLDANQIYNLCIEKLMTDRLTKTRHDHNTIIFEEYGSKLSKWVTNVEEVIAKVDGKIQKYYGTKLSYQVEVHSKEDSNLAIIDYLNFLFVQFFEHSKVEQRMVENFKIIEPKIAMVYKMDQDLFYDSKTRIDVNKY